MKYILILIMATILISCSKEFTQKDIETITRKHANIEANKILLQEWSKLEKFPDIENRIIDAKKNVVMKIKNVSSGGFDGSAYINHSFYFDNVLGGIIFHYQIKGKAYKYTGFSVMGW